MDKTKWHHIRFSFPSRSHVWKFSLILPFLFVITLRNGINFWGYDEYALDWVKSWPKPVSVFSVENFGDLGLAKALSIDTRVGWILLHTGLTLAVLAIFYIFVSKQIVTDSQKRNFFLIVLASPISMMLMQEIGYFDVITILGAMIIGLGSSKTAQFLGALIMCSGNTPQALVASFLFGCLLSLLESRNYRIHFKFFIPFGVAGVVSILDIFWYGNIVRVDDFGPWMWAASSKGFLIASPLFLYMLLGPLWILIPNILKAINEFQSNRKILMLVLVLVIPGIFGIITTESLRDALCIMAPMFFWSCHYFIVNHNLQISRIQILAICLLPNFLIWREGAIIEPWGILRRFFY